MPSLTGDSDLTLNPDGFPQFVEPDPEPRSCSYNVARNVSIAVVKENHGTSGTSTLIVGVYADPRTAMDAARRSAPNWATPRVITQNLHHSKAPFPVA
jgi:hypothetical protein